MPAMDRTAPGGGPGSPGPRGEDWRGCGGRAGGGPARPASGGSRGRAALLAVSLAVAVAGGCAIAPGTPAAPGISPAAPAAPAAMKPVWVVRHRWHTRIAVRRSDLPPEAWPESRDVGHAAYLEVGWGDRGYYPKPDPTALDAINAVIRPTPAAMFVGGLALPPPTLLPADHWVCLPASAEGLAGLVRYIRAHYGRGPDGHPVRIGPGDYPQSWFYEAEGRYHAFRQSNHWTARALQAAGLPVRAPPVLTAGRLMAQLRDLARARGPCP